MKSMRTVKNMKSTNGTLFMIMNKKNVQVRCPECGMIHYYIIPFEDERRKIVRKCKNGKKRILIKI